MSKRLTDLLPGVYQRAVQTLAYANSVGIAVTVTSTRRTRAEQRRLYEGYTQAVADGTFGQPGGLQYPANRPGDSSHEHGLAFDSVTVRPEQADAWIKIRKAFGWRVPDNDPVHSELPRWREFVVIARRAGYDV